MKSLLVSLIVMMSLSPIMAQPFVYNELATQKQIPVAGVQQVFHDSEGFVWYATDGGLCRDDGYRVDVFRSDLHHPMQIGISNNVRRIIEDKNGNIVFSTLRGVFYLDKKDYSIHLLDQELIGKRTPTLFCDSKGFIWISYRGYVLQYDDNYQCVGNYPTNVEGKREEISMFTEDDNHVIWSVGWEGYILKFDAAKKIFVPVHDMKCNLFSLEWDGHNNCLWIGSWGKGVFRYETDKAASPVLQIQTKGNGIASQIHNIKYDANRNLVWVVSIKNIHAYLVDENKELHKITLPHTLSTDISYTLNTSLDSNGNVWVAGLSPRTFVLSSNSPTLLRKTYKTPNFSDDENSSIVYATADNQYTWILAERLGIMAYRKENPLIVVNNIPEAHNLQFTNANLTRCYRNDKQQGIWMGNNNHLVHVWIDSKDKLKWESVAQINEPLINAIYDDADNHTVYIGGTEYIYGYDYKKLKFERLCETNVGQVHDIAISPEGDVYAATELKGLIHLIRKGEKWKYNIIQEDNSIQAICTTADGLVYMACNNGYVKSYHPQTRQIQTIETASNMNGDAIKDICIDPIGHLWIVSDLYFKEYSPLTQAYKIYRSDDKEINMNYFTSLYSDKSHVYICGSKAILKMTPNTELNKKTSTVRPRISSVQIDDSLVLVGNKTKEVRIEHNKANVVFHFTTLDHLHANNISFRYRLKGYDKQWHSLVEGSNSANYINLPKGNYTLELYATDLYGRWTDKAMTFSVIRLPAWWETWWAYTLYVLIIAAIFVYTLKTYLSRQQERRETEMERELTELKFRFFTNISHEIRTPLTLIITPLESLMNGLTTSKHVDTGFADKAAGLIPGIYNNARELKELINRLLDFRKLEMGQQHLYLSNGDVCDFLRAACEAFRPTTQQRGIALGCTVPDTPLYIRFDKDKLHHIVYNLLSNAIKFTPAGGSINITGNIQSGNLHLTVSDTGCGISKEAQQHIFDRFYQVNRSSDTTPAGTGIGLHMVKEYVTMMNGNITVESTPDKGTGFHVSIPIETTSGNSEEQADKHSQENHEEKATILLVDDTCEFLDFLKLELSGKYNILTASNGREALDKLNRSEHNIDIVLTDVMMPVMDGMELCRHIKTDMNLSHTLVMLLTAKTAEEAKLEGYKAGADAFISKPFNLELLLVRLQHLIDQRQARFQAYQQSDTPVVAEVTMNEMDKTFMEKMIALVETHIEESEYGPQELTEDMCMSRSTLYRKISSLTGEKPTEFVRNIRLKHAARLIKTGQYTISEISYMSGFSSQSYFSRCFKEYFGVSATAYK